MLGPQKPIFSFFILLLIFKSKLALFFNMNKKAQELPVSTIILIVIAIIVLILVMVFIIVPDIHGVKIFSNTSAPSGAMSSFKYDCSVYCGSASNNTPADTRFCTASIDYQGNIYHCYSQYDGAYIYDKGVCTYTASNGQTLQADASSCS